MAKDKDPKPSQNGPNKIDLTFRTPSGDQTVEANVNQPLKVAYNQALRDSGNDHLDPDEYRVRLGDDYLDLDQKVGVLGLLTGTVLRIQRRTGSGGGR